MKKLFTFMTLCLVAAMSMNAQTVNVWKNGEIVATTEDADSVVFVKKTATMIDGHEYVDLGLPSGLLWAACNIGAEAPEDYGQYYAWGETKGYGEEDPTNTNNTAYSGTDEKTNFSWNTYKYGTGRSAISKYCTDNAKWKGEGTEADGLQTLTAADDVAATLWGGAWRMPTAEEITELKDNCTLEATTIGDVKVAKLTGPNGKCIYIPMAGQRNMAALTGNDAYAYLWSSSVNAANCCYATAMSFIYATSTVNIAATMLRYTGYSVRAVATKE